jgi:hypothetical protein
MPEIVLFEPDRRKIRDLLQGKTRPSGILPGTWHRLTEDPDLDILEPHDLRLLAQLEPEIVRALGLPEVLP